MNRTELFHGRACLRAGALLGVVFLGLIGIVGSGGGVGFMGGDCPASLDCSGPVIPVPDVQPAYITVQVGTPVTFSASTTNVGTTPLSYQWYRSSDGGAHYVAIAGATGSALTLAGVNLADDGAVYQVIATAGGRSGSALGRLTVSSGPGVVFADGEFPLASWTAAPRDFANVAAPTHTEELAATGGHPGAYRRMAIQLAPAVSTAIVGHVWTSASYDPQSQGAVLAIDYAEEGISLETSSSKFTSSALLLEQAGRRYVATNRDSYWQIATVWAQSQNTPGLRATDFTLADGPACLAGAACPDFSSAGAPMRFGYWRTSSGPVGASVSHGIDNWKVTVWKR